MNLLSAMAFGLVFQTTGGSIVGTVYDADSGAPVLGAVVDLIDLDRTVLTGEEGRYRFDGVVAGAHRLTVRRIGYHARTVDVISPIDVELEVNVIIHLRPIQLQGIDIRTVGIGAGGAISDGRRAADRAVSSFGLRDHPHTAESDGFEGILGPGVAIQPETPTGLNINGGSSDQTGFLLDGIPVFNPYHSGGLFGAWSPDAVSEYALYANRPRLGFSDGLAGTLEARTRSPTPMLEIRGGISSTQARVALSGPVGESGIGHVFSLRSGLHDLIAPSSDPSYLTSSSRDWIGKIEIPIRGGTLAFLGFGAENELGTATTPSDKPNGGGASGARNSFEWTSRSIGVTWVGKGGGVDIESRAWRAASVAESRWNISESDDRVRSDRTDYGFEFAASRPDRYGRTLLGIRLARIDTRYESVDQTATRIRSDGMTRVTTLFGERRLALGSAADFTAGGGVYFASGSVNWAPQVSLQLRPGSRWTLHVGYARTIQFTQSLRNQESAASIVFPVDLFLGVGSGDVPVARNDQGTLSLEYQPLERLYFGVSGFTRRFDGVVEVATENDGPFALDAIESGSGTARGIAVEGTFERSVVSASFSYAWQRVRRISAERSYVPNYGNERSVLIGLVARVTETSSVRLGFTGLYGRRVSPILGELNLEPCLLVDRGCEFSGTPLHDPDSVGSVKLPAYGRVDIGARKDWRLNVRSREATLSTYLTLTNLLGRSNLFGISVDPDSGALTPLTLRPFAPLVFGVEWRF